MKIHQKILLLVLAFVLAAGRMYGADLRSTVLGLLRTYSPTGYHIVDTYAKAPKKYTFGSGSITVGKTDFMTWVDGTNPSAIVKSMNTVVHETCHGYTSLLGYTHRTASDRESFADNVDCYYVGGDEVILVPRTKTFPSREMAGTFTAEQKTFRFKTYITSKEASQGTQVGGIYGLLDEFNAYYHGTKVSFDLLPFYEERLPDSRETWFQYFTEVNGTYYAFLEFKLYIAKYLLYAREKHPDVYEGIMNNDAFRKAFSRIDRNWSDLIRDYFAVKGEITEKLRRKGYEVSEDDTTLWIGQNRSKKGVGNFVDTYKALEVMLGDKELVDILAPLYQ
jgi:hypothetical protein